MTFYIGVFSSQNLHRHHHHRPHRKYHSVPFTVEKLDLVYHHIILAAPFYLFFEEKSFSVRSSIFLSASIFKAIPSSSSSSASHLFMPRLSLSLFLIPLFLQMYLWHYMKMILSFLAASSTNLHNAFHFHPSGLLTSFLYWFPSVSLPE